MPLPQKPSAFATRRHGWLASLQNLLAPPTCLACQSLLNESRTLHVCDDCLRQVNNDSLPRQCLGCGARLKGQAGTVNRCHYCEGLKMPFASVTSLANYDGLLKSLVVRMKSRQGQVTAIQLGHWLAHRIADQIFDSLTTVSDFVTPTPSYWARRLRRGFNVSGLLADSICQLPQLEGKQRNLLVANRKTRILGTLTMRQRFVYVKGCFSFSGKPDVSGASILLVDDVMTSGATAIQAANVLLEAGARRVDLAIVARGIGRQN